MKLFELSYKTINELRGPLVLVEKVVSCKIGEIVKIIYPNGFIGTGEVLKVERDKILIQIFSDPKGLSSKAEIVFTDDIVKVPVSKQILNRTFDGALNPLDGKKHFIADKKVPITGYPINPVSRASPSDFIETGISAIDGLNTLVKGQKLPIFSSAGLPSKELVRFILKNSKITSENEFAIVFVAIGLSYYDYYHYFETITSLMANYVAFINLLDSPTMERLLVPRYGLTVAEYLAFDLGFDVLVIMSDMTNYCDALREISSAREELPGRRGYPGFMYSDLASLYERAGRLKNREGSITILPVLTMPEDDITHPIPDLTGYITEGQIVLSRELHQKNIFPPIDVLPSLSRLMNRGIGEGKTLREHRHKANQLYKLYAKGVDLRKLSAISGREGLPEKERKILDFADIFEKEFVNQEKRRDIKETLEIGINLINQVENINL